MNGTPAFWADDSIDGGGARGTIVIRGLSTRPGCRADSRRC
jgi:hypothetical protein